MPPKRKDNKKESGNETLTRIAIVSADKCVPPTVGGAVSACIDHAALPGGGEGRAPRSAAVVSASPRTDRVSRVHIFLVQMQAQEVPPGVQALLPGQQDRYAGGRENGKGRGWGGESGRGGEGEWERGRGGEGEWE